MRITHQVESNICIIAFSGNLNKAEFDEIAEEFDYLFLNEDYQAFIFNWQEAEFIDSAGMGWVISHYKALRNRGCSLVICEMNPQMLELFKMTGVDEVLSIYPTQAESVEFLLQERAAQQD